MGSQSDKKPGNFSNSPRKSRRRSVQTLDALGAVEAEAQRLEEERIAAERKAAQEAMVACYIFCNFVSNFGYFGKCWEARSRLYRRWILQVNTKYSSEWRIFRWKASDEIYKIHEKQSIFSGNVVIFMLHFVELLSTFRRLSRKSRNVLQYNFGSWRLIIPGHLEIWNQISEIWNLTCSKSEMRAH